MLNSNASGIEKSFAREIIARKKATRVKEERKTAMGRDNVNTRRQGFIVFT